MDQPEGENYDKSILAMFLTLKLLSQSSGFSNLLLEMFAVS